MPAPPLLVALAALLALTVSIAVLVVRRRRAHARAVRRREALLELADAMGALSRALARATAPHAHASAPPPPPGRRKQPFLDPLTGLPGRTALLDDLHAAVEGDSSLPVSLALLEAPDAARRDAHLAAVVEAARVAAPTAPAYRAGDAVVALVVQGTRAEAIATAARVEASVDRSLGLRAAVAECDPGEDAVSFLTRAARAL